MARFRWWAFGVGAVVALLAFAGSRLFWSGSGYDLVELDGSIVVGQSDGNCSFGYQSELIAVNAETGSVLWQVDVPWTQSQPIAIADGLVALPFHGQDGKRGLLAVQRDGTPAWQVFTDGNVLEVIPTADGLVIATWWNNGGLLMGIDAMTGERVWRQRTDHIFGGPVATDTGVVMSTSDMNVALYDPGSGELIWTIAAGAEVAGGVLREGDSVFIPMYTEKAVLEVSDDGSTRRIPAGVNVQEVLAIVDDVLVVRGSLDVERTRLAGAALDGSGNVWKKPTDDRGSRFGVLDDLIVYPLRGTGVGVVNSDGKSVWDQSPETRVSEIAVDGDVAYVSFGMGNTTPILAAIRLSGVPDLVFETALPGEPLSEPMVVGELVLQGGFISTDSISDITALETGWLTAVDATTGEVRWAMKTRDAVQTVTLASDTVFAVTGDPWYFCD